MANGASFLIPKTFLIFWRDHNMTQCQVLDGAGACPASVSTCPLSASAIHNVDPISALVLTVNTDVSFDSVSVSYPRGTFAHIQKVGGQLYFHQAPLPVVLFPVVTYVGGLVHVALSPSITMFDVSLLTFAGGNVDVFQNTGLLSIKIQSLISSVGFVSVWDNTVLTSLDLTGLEILP